MSAKSGVVQMYSSAIKIKILMLLNLPFLPRWSNLRGLSTPHAQIKISDTPRVISEGQGRQGPRIFEQNSPQNSNLPLLVDIFQQNGYTRRVTM